MFFDTGFGDEDTATSVSQYCGMTEPDFSKLHKEYEELQVWKHIGELTSFKKIH